MEHQEGGPADPAPAPAPAKRRRRRRQRPTAAAEADDEAQELRRRLLRRSGGGRRRDGEAPPSRPEERLLLTPYLMPPPPSSSRPPADVADAVDGPWSVVNPSAVAAVAAAAAATTAAASTAASAKPDVQFPTADQLCRRSPWVCALCGREQSGAYRLGPLYGPYYLPEETVRHRLLPAGVVFGEGGGGGGGGGGRKRAGGGGPSRRQRVTSSGEAWLHLDCALWSPDVRLTAAAGGAATAGGGGVRLTGLADCLAGAVGAGGRVCAACGQWGAQVACVHRQCHTVMHVPCAVEADCLLDAETLIAYCSQHKQSRLSAKTTD